MTLTDEKSKGHLFFKDDYEFYAFGGNVYRASLTNAFDVIAGVRHGRFEHPNHMTEWMKANKLYPYDGALVA